MQPATGNFLEPFFHPYCGWLYADSYWWTTIGFAGNALFGSRFIFQWLASERKHELVVPDYFWHLSFWGSVLNTFYAFHLDNAPLVLGVIALPFIYGRNLILLGRKQSAANRSHKPSPRIRLPLNNASPGASNRILKFRPPKVLASLPRRWHLLRPFRNPQRDQPRLESAREMRWRCLRAVK